MLSDRLSVRCDNAQRDWMISHAASFLLQREREKVCLFAYTVRISAWFPAHSSRQENCYLKNNCAVISEYGPYLCGTVCVCVCVGASVVCAVTGCIEQKHTAELPNRGGNYSSHAILTKPRVARMNPVCNVSHTLRPGCKTFRAAERSSERRRRRAKDVQDQTDVWCMYERINKQTNDECPTQISSIRHSLRYVT